MKKDIQLDPYSIELVALEGGQVVDWGNAYLKAEDFYRASRGEGAVIFIIDTAGQFTDHPDLRPNCLPEYDRNITNSPPPDAHGHGTHCAGISAAADNNIGVIGIAPGAKLVALKALNDTGGGSFNWVADQVRYAADIPESGPIKNKKRIISMSLGGPAGMATPPVLKSAIDYAIEKGAFIFAAAGNSGAGDGSKSTVGAPGRYGPVIAVASTDRPGTSRSGFSSVGNEVDIAAPGGQIYSTHRSGGYARLSGTSMACPQMAGVAALLLSAYPEIVTQAQLTAFLAANITDILSPGIDRETGMGTPVLTEYLDLQPGEPDEPDEPDTPDDPVDDPVDEEPEQPAEPVIPRRPNVATTLFPSTGQSYVLQWRANDERALKNLIVSALDVRVTGDVSTEYLATIVRAYVADWFGSRVMVIREKEDVRDALVWCAAFLQFNADDDRAKELFGIRMDLVVDRIVTHTDDGVPVSVERSEIAARVKDLEQRPAAAAALHYA